MISRKPTQESGFTAVELLITLIIASLFLFAGYQLYTQVMRDGTASSKMAILSNLLRERMRSTAAGLPATCAASGPTTQTQTVAGVGSVTYSTTVSCPLATELPTLKLIRVDATYDDNKKVSHAVYAN